MTDIPVHLYHAGVLLGFLALCYWLRAVRDEVRRWRLGDTMQEEPTTPKRKRQVGQWMTRGR